MDTVTRIKAGWVVAGIAISILTAVATSAIYVNGLLMRIDRLEKQNGTISDALSGKTPATSKRVQFNGENVDCGVDGLFKGISISSDITKGVVGNIECVRVRLE
jgi:hypothetical protein